MFVVYLYPNDGSDTVTLATIAGGDKRARNRAIRTVTERTLATDLTLQAFPKGVVCVRRIYSADTSHVIRSWKVAKLVSFMDPRESAQGTGSVRAYGVNRKGKISGRVFRTNGIADSIGALACLRKHPADASRYPIRSADSGVVALKPDPRELVYKASRA